MLGVGVGCSPSLLTSASAALPAADPAQKVLMGTSLVKLRDLSPLIRNTNVTSSPLEIKAGPQALIDLGDGVKTMWFEGVQNTGYITNNGETAAMKATAPTWQGPWTVSPATLVMAAGDTTTWEYNESSPSSVVKYGSGLVMTFHGGNNTGPAVGGPKRQMGVARCADTAGLSWVKDGSNPLISPGASGSWDDVQSGNDFKIVRGPTGTPGNPWTGAIWAVFRGRKSGQTDGFVGRATISPDYTTFTKGDQVISVAPSWNAGGVTAGTPFYDYGGRAHMFAPGGAAGIGYYYSDDDGLTWTAGNSGNTVAAPSGIAGAYDKVSTGDVVQGWPDGDVIFLTHGVDNISDYTGTGGAPLRAVCAAITPFPKVTPTRKAKFHLTSSRTTVDTNALNAIVSPLNQTVFSMCGRFRAYRIDRSGQPRRLWSENDSVNTFNKTNLISIENTPVGGVNTGKLHVFFRTPGGIIDLYSLATVDDALWHTWLFRRIGLASWEFYLDGVSQWTSVTSIALDATAMDKAIGSNPSNASPPDQPSNCTQSNLHLCNGYAMSVAEANALMTSGTAPPSGTLTVNWPTVAYTDSGNVVTVEGS